MRAILSKALELMDAGIDTVLVTVIDACGSTPRGVGTQMLVSASGLEAGTVGGGIVEFRAIQCAQTLLGGRLCKAYRADHQQGAQVNSGTACGGSVGHLFIPIGADDRAWGCVLRTAIRSIDAQEGATLRFDLPLDETAWDAFEGSVCLWDDKGAQVAGWFELPVGSSSASGVRTGSTRIGVTSGSANPATAVPATAAPTAGIVAGAFLLPLAIPQRVVIWGGGHVAQALVPVLASVGFACTVVEERPALADEALFPDAAHVIVGDYGDIASSVSLRPTDFAISMTHSHECDYQVISQLVTYDLAYVGLMGSKRKIAGIRAKLEAAGADLDAYEKVHKPIGLDILAQTPAEIAISIAAELIRARAELAHA